MSGNFLVLGNALVFLLQSGDSIFDQTGAAALLTRRPVEPTQAVEYRPPDLVFRIGLELHIVPDIIAVDRGDQTDNSSRNEIVQTNRPRDALMNATRDETDLRQMLQDEFLSLLWGYSRGKGPAGGSAGITVVCVSMTAFMFASFAYLTFG